MSLVLFCFLHGYFPLFQNIISSPNDSPTESKRRLSVFRKLQHGKELSEDRSLPHIRSSSLYDKVGEKKESLDDKFPSCTAVVCQQERCWKALMLPPEGEEALDEWSIVQEHFSNSRSKKVLKIIQQK
uniref:Uncharacterized protein n=1 Tax=Entomoneis paludosa TaxID=265537 RepID=A0A7S3DWU7_9STRA|mmetsp:Transcript_4495/g.9605  ORF Transcript_4495/g.9605 Transcript_4495/m.9605 type:complete len:128 (+) Transcript_4495:75-458(+)